MAVEKIQPMRDREIVAAVDSFVTSAVGYEDTKLSSERTKVLEYYNEEKPQRSRRGQSSYISSDVYDAVEQAKAQLLETFASGHRIVKFAAVGPEDVEPARIATEVCDWVVFRQNPGFEIFHDVIHDGLTARVGVAKVWWEADEEEVEEVLPAPVSGLTLSMVQPAAGVVALAPGELAAEGQDLYRTIRITYDRSQVRIKPLPPSEFLLDRLAVDIEGSNCAHRQRKTRSDLRKMGVPEKTIEGMGTGDGWDLDEEAQARLSKITDDYPGDEEALQKQLQKIWVYEAYMDLDVDGDGQAELWKITVAGKTILDKERVSRKPFVTYIPLRTPHTIFGNNFAQRMVSTQNAKTVLVRSVLDHTVSTNVPRWQVVRGTIDDPKELLDNRLGGIVNVKRPDGILPLPQQPLNPYVFQGIELLSYQREEKAGVSRLSTGLNKDAVSKQNSYALVEQLTSAGMIRQKIAARNFSQFLVGLYLLVYELVLENLSRPMAIEVAGNWVEVSSEGWRSRRDVSVELHLGYGEQDREAETWLMVDQLFSQDPATARLYTVAQKYNLLKRVLELKGIKNIGDYLTPPEQAEPPQPSPAEQLQFQIEGKRLEIMERQQALAEAKFQLEAEEKRARIELEKFKAESTHALKSDKLDLDEREQEHDERVDMAEVRIMEEEARNKAAERPKVIVSPNS